MVHHHADCQHILSFVQRLDAVLVAVLYPQLLELRQVLRDRIIEGKFALFHQFGDSYAAEAFCLRALHKYIVQANGTFRLDIGITDAADFLYTVVVENANSTGQFTSVKVGLQRLAGNGCFGIDNFLLRCCSQAKRNCQ